MSNNGEDLPQVYDDFINDWFLLFISALGIITNALNIALCVRQKLHSSLSIPLLYITVWNLFRCVSSALHHLSGPIELISKPHGISWRNMTSGFQNFAVIFGRNVSYLLTAYMSVTRCLSVRLPFKVKSMLTTRLTIFVVVIISVVTYSAYFVLVFTFYVRLEYSPEFNTTILTNRLSNLYLINADLINKYFAVSSLAVPFFSFTILSLSSLATVYYLKRSFNFAVKGGDRKQHRKTNFRRQISEREKKVSKILLIIVFLSIGIIFPQLIFYIAQLVEPEFCAYKKYHNLFMLILSILISLDLLNTSVGFFVCLKLNAGLRSFMSTCAVCSRAQHTGLIVDQS